MSNKKIGQNSSLTFKYNRDEGRHGWLRLTPAYSVKLVHKELDSVDVEDSKILDPFSGTGTTPLASAHLGADPIALELNPFLVWFSRVKTKQYRDEVANDLQNWGKELADLAQNESIAPCDPPPISNIERWWDEPALKYLCYLMGGIKSYEEEDRKSKVIDLLKVVFSRTMKKLSNTAHDHQSLSFDDESREESQLDLLDFDLKQEYRQIFEGDLKYVVESITNNPPKEPQILKGDSRNTSDKLDEPIDYVLTSPPYPNRMSYIRELRPYMYWLEYLVEASEAGELDWEAIGGTWGVATSRLKDWDRNEEDGYYPDYLLDILDKIDSEENRNGNKMSSYVARYFEDIYTHLQDLIDVLSDGASVCYIVGNSTFYGNLVPAERIYCEMLSKIGFENVENEIIRKRNSKKELYEFAIRGDWYS